MDFSHFSPRTFFKRLSHQKEQKIFSLNCNFIFDFILVNEDIPNSLSFDVGIFLSKLEQFDRFQGVDWVFFFESNEKERSLFLPVKNNIEGKNTLKKFL